MSRTDTTPSPPSSEFLHTLLFNLLPPRLPFPPELLSTDIKTRHLYLPPTPASPDSYICQRAASDRDVVDRLYAIDEEWEQAGHHEVPRASLHDRIEDLDDVQYQQKDEQTVLCRFEVKPPNGPGVQVVLIHEGQTAGWLLFDTGLDPGVSDGWFQSPSKAHRAYLDTHAERTRRNPHPEHLDDDDDDGEQDGKWGGNGNAGDPRGTADDFWGGYSDDEKEAKPVKPHSTTVVPPPPPPVPSIVPPPRSSRPPPSEPSRQGSVAGSVIEDTTDTYWSSYASVEDGLRASNPPSRVASVTDFGGFGTSAAGRGGGRGGYWGTGGETPVAWSPEPEPAPPAIDEIAINEPAQQDEPSTIDLSSSTESLVVKPTTTNKPQLNDRQKALQTTLQGLYEMYVGQGDVGQLGEEFRSVLRGF